MEIALCIVVAVGIGLWCLLSWSQRQILRAEPRKSTRPLPPVSILKPIKGLEPRLEENLESFFLQEYPEFEILFGAEHPEDPAVAVARRIIARHPEIRASIHYEPLRPGWNPKVSNLANALGAARHGILLISDSNVEARQDYLRSLVPELLRPGVGLVSSLFRGRGGRGFGGLLEGLQLNGFVGGSVSMVYSQLGLPCVVGKSMLLRREDLDGMGGLPFLSGYLAEDQVCGEEIHRRGLRTAVAGGVVDNVLGRRSVRDFVDRHVRWSKIRWRICPAAYSLELLLNPTFLAFLGATCLGTVAALATAGLSLAAMSVLQASMERRLGVRRPWWAYPPLEALRAVMTGLVWPLPLLGTHVTWRGTRVWIGPRTLIQPLRADAQGAMVVPAFDRPAPRRAKMRNAS